MKVWALFVAPLGSICAYFTLCWCGACSQAYEHCIRTQYVYAPIRFIFRWFMAPLANCCQSCLMTIGAPVCITSCCAGFSNVDTCCKSKIKDRLLTKNELRIGISLDNHWAQKQGNEKIRSMWYKMVDQDEAGFPQLKELRNPTGKQMKELKAILKALKAHSEGEDAYKKVNFRSTGSDDVKRDKVASYPIACCGPVNSVNHNDNGLDNITFAELYCDCGKFFSNKLRCFWCRRTSVWGSQPGFCKFF